MKSLTVAIALVGIVAAAQADSLRSQIIKGDAAFSKVMKANDMAGFAKLMKAIATPDFKYTEGGQSMSMDKMLEMMKMGMSQWKHVTKAEATLLSFKQSGKTATTRTRHYVAGTTVGPDKKSHTMTFTGDSTDSYVKVGGQWKLSAMVWGKSVSTYDGKEMNPQVPPTKSGTIPPPSL